MYRTGALQYLLSKNGNGHSEISELKEQIATLQNNHLHEISEKLDDVKKAIEKNTEALSRSVDKTTETFSRHFEIEIKSQALLENIIKNQNGK